LGWILFHIDFIDSYIYRTSTSFHADLRKFYKYTKRY
jgi:hypothetical protein